MSALFKFTKDFLNGDSIHIAHKHGDTSYIIHSHDYYEIIHYKNCGGNCVVNGKLYPLTDNCIFMLTPKDYHKTDAVNDENSSSTVISFSESIIDNELLQALGFSARVYYDPSEDTVNHINSLCDCYTKSEKLKSRKLYHLINIVLTDILERDNSLIEDGGYLNPIIRKAMTIAIGDIEKNIPLSEIAARCGVAYSYFSDLFHKETGQFKNWLTDVRIEEACRMLEESNVSILEISYDCGYNTPSQFMKMFKKKMGETPLEYRHRTNNSAQSQKSLINKDKKEKT